MSFESNGRRVVVTGATGELGAAVVLRLARAGVACHVPCRTAAKAERLVREVGDAVRVTDGVDLTDEASVSRYFESLPPIDGSVHCVGGFAPGALEAATAEALAAMIDVNVLPALACTRAAVAAMRSRRRPGRIVNVAALAGLEPGRGAGAVAYAMAKAAVVALTRAAAAGARADGIAVNAVAPDALATPANRAASAEEGAAGLVPLDAVAATVEWLLAPDALGVTGVVVPLGGGRVAP